MTNDPISDLLIQVKNGYLAKKESVTLNHSIFKEKLAKLLQVNQYVSSVKNTGEKQNKKLVIDLLYIDKSPAIVNLQQISKPGLRVYINHTNLPKIIRNLGITILSTPAGLMTAREAKKKNLGGEVICKIW